MNFKVTYAGGHVTSIQTFKSLFLIYYIQRGLVKKPAGTGSRCIISDRNCVFLTNNLRF